MVVHSLEGKVMRRIALLLISASGCVAQPAGVGIISGRLIGEDGTIITGARVSLLLTPPHPTSRVRRLEWSMVSGGGGSFRFDGLADGRHRLCAQMLDSTWLNPCEWGLQSPVVSLPGAERIVSVTMVLKRGVAVPIRVDDPGRLLLQNEGKIPGAHLLLGVENDAFAFRPARVVSEDANGRNHQIVIPFNTPVKLVVHSSFFRLSDAAGVPLPRTAVSIPVIVPPGQQPTAVTLKVTGGSPP
jgi:hypothetical protein